MNKYLILDCNYLCHRAKHVFSELYHEDKATGVIYGVLHDIVRLIERFETENLIFCWDGEGNKRKAIYPEYKANHVHKDLTPEEIKFEKSFYIQMEKLKNEYLKTIGFNNIFCVPGYEGDDLIAYFCKRLNVEDEAIIVSTDQDLYQLLTPHISCYLINTHQVITYKYFVSKHKISPRDWAKVKAIAGCTSDNVKGIWRVGEKLAIAYLHGELSPFTKSYKAIKNGWKDIVLRNRKLVELPLEGLPEMTLYSDKVTQQGWNKVTKSLGMKSIRYRKGI